MLELTIDDRILIPVRLIPFMTGWQFSPDEVAQILAEKDKWHRVFVSSFHVLANSHYEPMLPKEWDVVLADMDILCSSLKSKETIEDENYSEWRKKSLNLLHAGTFVWFDEFESVWNTAYSTERITLLEERPGDRTLNLSPYIPPVLSKSVYEGFGQQVAEAKQHEIERYNFETHFNEFAVELPKLKQKLEELESIKASDMKAYQGKEWLFSRICGLPPL